MPGPGRDAEAAAAKPTALEAWAAPHHDDFPLRLPFGDELPKAMLKPPPKKLSQRVQERAQKAAEDPGSECAYLCSELKDFFFHWFGSLRYDHTAHDDILRAKEELENAKITCNPDRTGKIDERLKKLAEHSDRVAHSTRRTSLQAKKPQLKASDHFGRVKRPRNRNPAMVHPDHPRRQPIVRIKVIAAGGLRMADGMGLLFPDPYVVCKVKGKGKHEPFETSVQNNTVEPKWDEDHEFPNFLTGDSLEFQVWDKDLLSSDLLGNGALEPSHFFPDGFYGKVFLADTGESHSRAWLSLQVRVVQPAPVGWGLPVVRRRGVPTWTNKSSFEEEQEAVDVGWQHIPYFALLQIAVCWVVWLIFRGGFINGLEAVPGLDGKTTLMWQRDCFEDYRMQVWRALTYQYTHAGFNHIFFNCVMLLAVGTPLEGFNGFFRTAVMFHLGVAGGALSWMLFDVHTETVGMSGGCYSLIGITIGDTLMNRTEARHIGRVLALCVVIVGIDVINHYFAASANVSNAAHFGGLLSGTFWSILIGRNVGKPDTIDKVLRVVSTILMIAIIMLCLWFAWGRSTPEVPEDVFERVPFCWWRQATDLDIFGDGVQHCIRCANESCVEQWTTALGSSCNGTQKCVTVSVTDCSSKYGGWSDALPL